MAASRKRQKREQAKTKKTVETKPLATQATKKPHFKEFQPKTPNQEKYLEILDRGQMIFCTGPAGSGKTFLAIMTAAKKLLNREVERIILTRPAVEAGEKFGFLPGDLKEKIDPYLQPAYDALYTFLGHDKVEHFIDKDIITVSPLAFMRGRTFHNAFVILDEAQNVTRSQMKMFLTRMGEGTTMVINGDKTQTDLRKSDSGLLHSIELLSGVEGIEHFELTGDDIVRHPLVKKILWAYEMDEKAQEDIKNRK